MITLYGFGPALGLKEVGPFVNKLDIYLKMAGFEHKREYGFSALRHAPKGKLPYIKLNDEIIGDSYFVIKLLEERSEQPLDAHLTDEQRSLNYLLSRALDENLYWCLVYSRWSVESSWPQYKKDLLKTFPVPLGYIVLPMARRAVNKQLHSQGFGRHSMDQLLHITELLLQSFSELLGDKEFFFGDKPATLDASAYGMLSGLIDVSLSNEFTQLAKSFSNLSAYTKRIATRYPD